MKTSISNILIYICGCITGITGILAWLYWQIYRDPVLPTEDEWEKEYPVVLESDLEQSRAAANNKTLNAESLSEKLSQVTMVLPSWAVDDDGFVRYPPKGSRLPEPPDIRESKVEKFLAQHGKRTLTIDDIKNGIEVNTSSIADTQPIVIEPIAFFDRVLTDDEIKEYTRRYSKSLVDTQPIKIEDFYEPDASDFDKWEKESE